MMSQMSNQPLRRSGGGVDVYTGLLCVAFLVLAAGVFAMVTRNLEHSKVGTSDGGVLKLVERPRR